MARRFTLDHEGYTLEVVEEGRDIRLHLQFKVQPVATVEATDAGRGARVTVPSTEHHRRKGVYEDEVIVLSRGDGIFEVESRTEPGSFHVVHMAEDGTERCDCQAAAYGRKCRHVKAVRILQGHDPDAPLRPPPGIPLETRAVDAPLQTEILNDTTG